MAVQGMGGGRGEEEGRYLPLPPPTRHRSLQTFSKVNTYSLAVHHMPDCVVNFMVKFGREPKFGGGGEPKFGEWKFE